MTAKGSDLLTPKSRSIRFLQEMYTLTELGLTSSKLSLNVLSC